MLAEKRQRIHFLASCIKVHSYFLPVEKKVTSLLSPYPEQFQPIVSLHQPANQSAVNGTLKIKGMETSEERNSSCSSYQ